jgi:hypothetical protein
MKVRRSSQDEHDEREEGGYGMDDEDEGQRRARSEGEVKTIGLVLSE